MKGILLFILAFLLLTPAFAQDGVKNKVEDFVWQKYPESAELDWVDTKNGYTVSFYDGNRLKTAIFNASGDWVQTETNILQNDLDADIKNSITQAYPGSSMSRIQMIEADTYYYYLVVITYERSGLEIKLDPMGGILKTAPVLLEEDEEEFEEDFGDD